MSPTSARYDIFLSHAGEDETWVRDHLVEPLQRCRRLDNKLRVSVFVCVDGCLKPGGDYHETLAGLIEHSRFFLPVYSRDYFDSNECRWEINTALTLLNKNTPRLMPVLRDISAQDAVPLHVRTFQYVKAGDPQWWEQLCKSLEIREAPALSLSFVDQPRSVEVNQSLPTIRVAVADTSSEEEIELACDSCGLQGTTKVRTKDRMATFSDLSITAAAASTRLIAIATGVAEVRSEEFSVTAAATHSPAPAQAAGCRIDEAGEPVFFGNGKAIAIFGMGVLSVWSVDGQRLGRATDAAIDPRYVRIIVAGPDQLVVATWAGRIHVLDANGGHRRWDLGAEMGYSVPGAIAVSGRIILVGRWNGDVQLLADGQTDPLLLLRHHTGVCALAADEGRVYVCGFDKQLCAYREGRLVNSCTLEQRVRAMRFDGDSVIAVADGQLYKIRKAGLRFQTQRLPLDRVAHQLIDTPLPVVVDSRGRGLRFDSDLAIRTFFHAAPGATPTSADHLGKRMVLRYPDGSHTLMVGRDIVFTHPTGPLAISAAGDRLAMGADHGLLVMRVTEFEAQRPGAGHNA